LKIKDFKKEKSKSQEVKESRR